MYVYMYMLADCLPDHEFGVGMGWGGFGVGWGNNVRCTCFVTDLLRDNMRMGWGNNVRCTCFVIDLLRHLLASRQHGDGVGCGGVITYVGRPNQVLGPEKPIVRNGRNHLIEKENLRVLLRDFLLEWAKMSKRPQIFKSSWLGGGLIPDLLGDRARARGSSQTGWSRLASGCRGRWLWSLLLHSFQGVQNEMRKEGQPQRANLRATGCGVVPCLHVSLVTQLANVTSRHDPRTSPNLWNNKIQGYAVSDMPLTHNSHYPPGNHTRN